MFLIIILLSCNPEEQDSRLIAFFASPHSRLAQIYVMDVDTREIMQLTEDNSFNAFPAWSPDGKQIAFDTTRDQKFNDNFEIYVVNVDGSGMRNLTNHPDSDRGAAWSPDGKWIAFTSNRDGDEEIFLINVLTNAISQLTHNNIFDISPSWSPDSKRIVYISGLYDGLLTSINVMDLNGSNNIFLVRNIGYAQGPTWSPDGKWLAFISNKNGWSAEIFLYNFETKNLNQLTYNGGGNNFPAWSPDSSQIVFARSYPGTSPKNDLFIINIDGSGLMVLTDSSTFFGGPAWQP